MTEKTVISRRDKAGERGKREEMDQKERYNDRNVERKKEEHKG